MPSTSEITAGIMLPMRLPKGFAIESYVVDGWLRDGGMAAIYRAHRADDDERVALKLQLPSTTHDPAMSERFDREATLLRRAVDSRHVVDLLDAGALADGRRYLVMEWVEGENLEELLDFLRNMDQRLPMARACRICRDVARGLAELHEHGVVHLDLKPANVMVRPGADGRDEIKLVDLGIAADLRELDDHAGQAPVSAVLGTSAYAAPERVRGLPVDPSFDVYALGVLSFEAISGSCAPPHHWMIEALPRLETLRYGVPTALADLVQACMDVDPQRRPVSAVGVASALVAIIRGLEAAEPRSASRGPDGPVRTGQTEVTPRSSVLGPDDPVEAPVKARAAGFGVTHDEGTGPASGPSERGDDAASESTKDDLGDESDFDEEAFEPTSRRWLRWMTLGAAASLLVAGIGLSRGGGVGSVGSARVEEHETLEDGPALMRASTRAAALASGRSPSSLGAGDRPSVAKRASGLAERRREGPSPEACRKKRTQAETAKAERRWRDVVRMTDSRACWTGTEQRLQRKRLRVDAFAELHEYERCVGAGRGSRDGEILQGVSYCRMKLGRG